MSYVGQIKTGSTTSPVASTLYGECGTAADVAEKVVTCNDFDQLITGVTIHVKFANSNTAPSGVTLNVNGTGAKPIIGNTGWKFSTAISFTYDGSSWVMNGIPSPFYPVIRATIRCNNDSYILNTTDISSNVIYLIEAYNADSWLRSIYLCTRNYSVLFFDTIIDHVNYLTIKNESGPKGTVTFTNTRTVAESVVNSAPPIILNIYEFLVSR